MLNVATVWQIKFPVVLVLISLSLCDCVQVNGDLNTRFSLIFFSLIEEHFLVINAVLFMNVSFQ